jgi:hypothetical protein
VGTLFKKQGTKQWQMGVMFGGRQICRSAHTTNKGIAKKLLARWETEVFEGRFHLPHSTPPYFEEWANDFLTKVSHPNTRKRYASSLGKLKDKFAGVRLSDVSADRIEEYKERRLAEGVEPATVNHDLRVCRMSMITEVTALPTAPEPKPLGSASYYRDLTDCLAQGVLSVIACGC